MANTAIKPTAPAITLPVIGYASAQLTSRTFHFVRRAPLTGSGYAALCGVHIGTLKQRKHKRPCTVVPGAWKIIKRWQPAVSR